MKSFVIAIVAVLLSLNVLGQTLRVDGVPFASCSICMECSNDTYGKKYSRIVVTSNLPMDMLDVKGGGIVVSKKDEVGRKIIEFLPNHGQSIVFYAPQCRPLVVEISEFVTGGAEYQMHIVCETNVSTEPVVEPELTSTTSTHQFVDLGLPSGTLWATTNVGADNPWDSGDYFAWGETKPKSTYSWDNYTYCRDGDYFKLTKYCIQSEDGYKGFTDNKSILDPSDDAATANWGSEWRMPTVAERDELIKNCYWVWSNYKGHNGYFVYKVMKESDKGVIINDGKTADAAYSPDKVAQHIFLPATGVFFEDELLGTIGNFGDYWLSSLYGGRCGFAEFITFQNRGTVCYDLRHYYRCYGCSVRPVRCKY